MDKLKNRRNILFGILLLSFLAYLPLLNGFFQQDEWNLFGVFISHGAVNFSTLIRFFLTPSGLHYAPLANIFSYIEFYLFGINFLGYALISILGHVLIVLLVYIFLNRLFKNKFIITLSTLFFGISAAGYQATTWIIANVSVQYAFVFALISLVLFLNFLKSNTLSVRKLVGVIFFLLISLLFKENAIDFFVFLPFLIFLLSDQKIKTKKMYSGIILFTGMFYGFFRVFLVFVSPVVSATSTVAQSKLIFLYNLVTFPIISVVQTFIPVELELEIARNLSLILPTKIRGEIGTTAFDVFVQKRMLEFVSFAIFALIIGCIIFLVKRTKDREIKNGLIFAISYIILNSFIYALSPDRVGIIPIVDSRNLYFLAFGSSVIISIFVYLVFKKTKKIGILLIILIVGINVFYLNRNIFQIENYGVVRKNILFQIKDSYPKLPNPAIFYVESDTSFYGLPEITRILPFQSGFGQTLLVWYESINHFPTGFFTNNFLWNIDSQGYQVINGDGFGYYRDFESLVTAISDNKVDKSSVISFSYDSKNNILTDITKQIQGRLDGYQVVKKNINPKLFKITSSVNQKDIQLTIDGKKSTFWDSKLPYSNFQYVQIDMGRIYNVAELMIDSGSDQNQKDVGYRIELSEDGKNWIKVFQSNKYPAQKDGQDSLYFKPTNAKYIKIEQIGSHKYASWIINELNVYAKN